LVPGVPILGLGLQRPWLKEGALFLGRIGKNLKGLGSLQGSLGFFLKVEEG